MEMSLCRRSGILQVATVLAPKPMAGEDESQVCLLPIRSSAASSLRDNVLVDLRRVVMKCVQDLPENAADQAQIESSTKKLTAASGYLT
jgi:hypothetical protein